MMRQKKELTTSKKMKTAFKRRPYLKYKFMAEGDSDAPSPLCLINMSTGLQMSRVEPLKMLWQFGVVFWIQIKAENPGVAPPPKKILAPISICQAGFSAVSTTQLQSRREVTNFRCHFRPGISTNYIQHNAFISFLSSVCQSVH